MVVGLVMDVVLVGLMAPTAVLGAPRAAAASGLPLLALLTMQGLSFGAGLMLCHVMHVASAADTGSQEDAVPC